MKTYVDGEITTANSNMKTYVDGEITTANSNMKTYVDGEITAIGAHYSDTDVANVLASFGSNTIETTGNITAENIIVTGNVFGLKSPPYSMSSNSYTLVAADQDRTIVTTATGNVYIDVPAESSVNFPVGTSISILQAGDGQVIFTNSSPVMLNTAGNSGALRNRYQFTTCGLYKYDSDTWVALGDLIV